MNALAGITLSGFSLYSFTEFTVGLRDKDGVCILYLLDDISQIIDIWDYVTKIFRSKGYSVINSFLRRARIR